MRTLNAITLQFTDMEKEVSFREGTIFLGCEVQHHEVIVWVSEPVDAPPHTVWLSCMPEFGDYDDNWEYVGFCANRVFADDDTETIHVLARCDTMEIRTTPPELNIANFVGGLAARIEALEATISELEKKSELPQASPTPSATKKRGATK